MKTVWVNAYDEHEALGRDGKMTLHTTREKAEYYRCEPQEMYALTVRSAGSVEDAIRLMASLSTAALEVSPTDETRALLRSTLVNMLDALNGVGHA